MDQNLDELYLMWQRRPPHVQMSVSWIRTVFYPLMLIAVNEVNSVNSQDYQAAKEILDFV